MMMTEKNRPKRGRLRRAIISLLSMPEYGSQLKLKAQIRKSYSNTSEIELVSAIETLLLELEEEGSVELQQSGRVVLTESGKYEQQSLAAQSDQKQRKKMQKTELKVKESETEKKKKVSKGVHDQLELQLGQLALLLGKTWKREYQLTKGGLVVLDVVWYEKANQLYISHAFEVQHRGDWKNAVGNLEAVKRRYPRCKLFILVFHEKQISGIQGLLGGRMVSSINILKVSQLREWLDVLSQVPDVFRPRIFNIVDEIKKSEIV